MFFIVEQSSKLLPHYLPIEGITSPLLARMKYNPKPKETTW